MSPTPSPTPIDDLAPQLRFALRGLGAGLDPAQLAALLRTDPATVHKHLRDVVRETSGERLGPDATETEVVTALAPALEFAAAPPTRQPATACPSPALLDILVSGGLAGPNLLAGLEHAADCPPCMAALVARA